jgi:hypothetical protein
MMALEGKKYNNSLNMDKPKANMNNFFDIDFIKIDVDSHEGYVIEGGIEFFKKNSPVIMIESKKVDQQRYQSSSMPDPIDILKKLNYTVVQKIGKADYILTKETL